jgi:hypothetical protein
MELKRLGFVLSYLNWGIDLASSTYSKGRSYTPKFVEGYVSSAEDAATSYGAPVYNQVQDLGSWGLEKADSVVRRAPPAPSPRPGAPDRRAQPARDTACAQEGTAGPAQRPGRGPPPGASVTAHSAAPARLQVDSTLTTLTSTLDYSRDLHNMNMKSFYTAKDTYFSWLDSGVQWVKATINPYPYVQWAVDTAWWTLDKVGGARGAGCTPGGQGG